MVSRAHSGPPAAPTQISVDHKDWIWPPRDTETPLFHLLPGVGDSRVREVGEHHLGTLLGTLMIYRSGNVTISRRSGTETFWAGENGAFCVLGTSLPK